MGANSRANGSFRAKISPMASGIPQPIPPDPSFSDQIMRRRILRAPSISLWARSATRIPVTVTACHFISSSSLQRAERSVLKTL